MDEFYMGQALNEAKKALVIGEVPIGAVIVLDGEIVGRGYNKKESLNDPTAHAEIIAIKDAVKNVKGWRLTNSVMYVTIEPCIMCTGAIYQARISKVFIGSLDIKGGAVNSLYNIFDDKRLNHIVEYEIGILKEECSNILQNFFKKLRIK